MKKREEVAALESKMYDEEMKMATGQGFLDDVNRRQAILRKCRDSKEKMVERLNKELEVVAENLKSAEADLKAYTYRMYGAFKYVWENDVNLAKEKVRRYTEEKEKLSTRLTAMQTANAESLKKDELDETQANTQKKKEAEQMIKSAQDAIGNLRANIKKARIIIVISERRLEKLVSAAGKVNAEHLLNSLESKQLLSTVASRADGTDENFNRGWRSDVALIATLMGKCLEANTLDKQTRCLGALEAHIRKDKLVFNVLKASKPILDLTCDTVETVTRPKTKEIQDMGLDSGEIPSECEVYAEFLKSEMQQMDIPLGLPDTITEAEKAVQNAGGVPSTAVDECNKQVEDAKKILAQRREAIADLQEAIDARGVARLAEACEKYKDVSNVSLLKLAAEEWQIRKTAQQELENYKVNGTTEDLMKSFARHKKVLLETEFLEGIKVELRSRQETFHQPLAITMPAPALQGAVATTGLPVQEVKLSMDELLAEDDDFDPFDA